MFQKSAAGERGKGVVALHWIKTTILKRSEGKNTNHEPLITRAKGWSMNGLT